MLAPDPRLCRYNEEANIGRLLEAIAEQLLDEVEIAEIIVVASGCTDRTEKIVRDQLAHADLSIRTGERIIVLTLAEDLAAHFCKQRH